MKKLFWIIMATVLAFSLSACGNVQEQDLQYIEVPDFPVEKIKCVENEMVQTQVPEEALLTETSGTIVQYLIHDQIAYYIVSYDYYYYDYYSQIAIFAQDIESGNFHQILTHDFENGISIADIFYTEQLHFIGYDEEGNVTEYIVSGGMLEEAEETPDIPDGREAVLLALDGYEVAETDTDGSIWLCGENDRCIVWEFWPILGENVDTYFGSSINILDKKTGEVIKLMNEEYGVVHTPVLYGNQIAFLTIDDIKSYENENDSYENVYLVDIPTLEGIRLTENQGTEDDIDALFYDEPRLYDEGICFLSTLRQAGEDTYQYLYYMDLE